MVRQGVLENPVPEAIFGLHVSSPLPSGRIGYRAGPLMASSVRPENSGAGLLVVGEAAESMA